MLRVDINLLNGKYEWTVLSLVDGDGALLFSAGSTGVLSQRVGVTR